MQQITSKRYLALLTGLLMLVSIVNVADKELLAPVVDAVKVDLDINDTQVGTVRSGVFLAALLGQFVWGPLSDRWVRKYIIATGTVIWSALTWMTAFVGSFPQLLLARAAMSFAEGKEDINNYRGRVIGSWSSSPGGLIITIWPVIVRRRWGPWETASM